MNKHLLPFAGYPIFLIKSSFHLNNEELNFLRNLNYKIDKEGQNLKISLDTDILRSDKLIKLKNFIKDCLNDYVSNVLEINNNFSFCQSWSTIQTKKGKHPKHLHPNHIISSVYYAKARETNLIFYINKSRIQEGFNFQYDVKQYNFFNSGFLKIPLNTGDIIFFPGHLTHESSINDDDERIVVGSSFFIDGEIGYKDSINNIDITNNKNLQYK